MQVGQPLGPFAKAIRAPSGDHNGVRWCSVGSKVNREMASRPTSNSDRLKRPLESIESNATRMPSGPIVGVKYFAGAPIVPLAWPVRVTHLSRTSALALL